MVGWDVYLCYKKSQGTSKRLAYKPTVLDYFPKQKKDEAFSQAYKPPVLNYFPKQKEVDDAQGHKPTIADSDLETQKKEEGVAQTDNSTIADNGWVPEKEEEELRLEQNIPLFCLPMGALIECWPQKCQPPEKAFTTFVLTEAVGFFSFFLGLF